MCCKCIMSVVRRILHTVAKVFIAQSSLSIKLQNHSFSDIRLNEFMWITHSSSMSKLIRYSLYSLQPSSPSLTGTLPLVQCHGIWRGSRHNQSQLEINLLLPVYSTFCWLTAMPFSVFSHTKAYVGVPLQLAARLTSPARTNVLPPGMLTLAIRLINIQRTCYSTRSTRLFFRYFNNHNKYQFETRYLAGPSGREV